MLCHALGAHLRVLVRLTDYASADVHVRHFGKARRNGYPAYCRERLIMVGSLGLVVEAKGINGRRAMCGSSSYRRVHPGRQGVSETADTGMDVLTQPPLAIEALTLSDTSFRPLLQHTGDACADSSHPIASGKA